MRIEIVLYIVFSRIRFVSQFISQLAMNLLMLYGYEYVKGSTFESKKVLISIGIVVIVVTIGSVLGASFSSSTNAATNFRLRTID
ncbi:MAG TPA: hypothetical protein VH500_23395 [Nitrososphaeraceae archaeon]